MVDISVENSYLNIRVLGFHKILAFKSRLRVPLRNVRKVTFDPSTFHNLFVGFRLPGTHIPGVLVAGTFYRKGHRDFWDVRNEEYAIVIDLENERYDRLIVEVRDPLDAASLIVSAQETLEAELAKPGYEHE